MTETNNKMGSQTFDENDDLSYIVDSVLNSTGLKKSYRANPNCEWILLIGDEDIKEGIKNLSQVDAFFNRICKKAEIPITGQHSLRHTFATRSIEAGVPAVVLQRWLGHTNIHITLDRYTDVFERMNTVSIERYDSYIDRIKEEMFAYVA